MTRLLISVPVFLAALALAMDPAEAQWGHHDHGGFHHGGRVIGGGHYDLHNGHIDYHQPSHYDYHNGHLDFHSGHIDHIVPQTHIHSYPTTVYPSVITSSPVYSAPVVTSGTIISTAPPTISTLKPPVVSGTPANALPAVASGATPNSRPITIRNPANYSTPLTFKLNDQQIRLEPGQQTSITFDRSYNIEFDRGGQYGVQRYSMQDGHFEFQVGDRGWDLRRYTEAANVSPQLSNPLPTNPLPPGGN